MYNFIRKILTVLITVWLILTLPITVLVLLPIYTFRCFVSFLSKWIRPDLNMLSTMSSIFAADTVYTCPRINLGLNFKFGKTHLTKSEIINTFSNAIINAIDSEGELIYPEFQQTLTSWLGFSFWKWENDFKIENHVFSITSGMVTPTPDHYLNKPFTKGQSPWEMIIFENNGKSM